MKRIALIFLIIILASGAVMGQGRSDNDSLTDITNLTMSRDMLEGIGLDEEQIVEILEYQLAYNLTKEEINNDLEDANDFRLLQEKAYIKAYMSIKEKIEDENWAKLMHYRLQTRTETGEGDQTRNQFSNRVNAPENDDTERTPGTPSSSDGSSVKSQGNRR